VAAKNAANTAADPSGADEMSIFMASSQGSANYKTAREFEEAMWLAFQSALQEDPDSAGLNTISHKWSEAEIAQKFYQDKAQETGPVNTEDEATHAARVELLRKTALRTRMEADMALRKWYSTQWRGRQTGRGAR
jgi:hypothetical protein